MMTAAIATAPHADLYVTEDMPYLSMACCCGRDPPEGAMVETTLEVDEGAINFAEYFHLHGIRQTKGTRCAPFVSYGGGRGELKPRIRSAISLTLIAVSRLT